MIKVVVLHRTYIVFVINNTASSPMLYLYNKN